MSESRIVGFGDAPVVRRRSRRGRALGTGRSFTWSWRLLCTATVLAALALGALHTISLTVVALLVFASAVQATASPGRQRIPAPAWVLFALAGYTLVQALPLPPGMLKALSPHAADVWQRAFDVSERRSWMSLSLDPGATLVEALKWATYGAAFISAASHGRKAGMLKGLLLPVAAPTAVAFVTIMHGLVGAQTIYGFYEPTVSRSIWHTGPLLNPNHLASYLNFGIFCALGLVATRRPVLPRWVLGVVLVFLLPNAVVAGSRGGVVGLVVGLVVFCLTLPKAAQADSQLGPISRLTLVGTMASVFAVAIGLTGLLATEQTAVQLYAGNIDKLRLLAWCGDLIGDHPWFGVGRGAFESVFTAYRAGPNNEIYSHPENLPTQWLGEWGIPVSVAAAAALAYSLRPRRLGAKWSVAASGVVAAMAAVLVQNFVDFGLEVPAIALTVTVALGLCWGHDNGRRRARSDSSQPSSARLPAIVGFTGLALVGLVTVLGGRPLVYERGALAAAYDALERPSEADLKSLQDLTEAFVLAHPAEPYFFRMGALLTWRLGDNPLPWLNRALERGPANGRTHLLLARYLEQKGVLAQALLELRLAATFDPNLATTTAHTALAWTQSHEALVRSVPEGEAGILALTLMTKATRDKPELRERLLASLAARGPRRLSSLYEWCDFFLQQLETPKTSLRCGADRRTECLAQADRILNDIEQLAPRDAQAVLLRSRLLVVQGEAARALALLGERCQSLPAAGRPRCLQQQLDLAFESGQTTDFMAAAKAYVAESCADPAQCGQALERVGDMSSRRGDWDAALGYYDRATREHPTDRLWLKTARAGVRISALARAANALGHIRNSSCCEPEYSALTKAVASGGVGRAGTGRQ
jgi:tetratricopeptide (TPR) repeat protein